MLYSLQWRGKRNGGQRKYNLGNSKSFSGNPRGIASPAKDGQSTWRYNLDKVYTTSTATMEARSLHPENMEAIKTYLDLPPETLLPADPLDLLSSYLHILPRPLLEPFTSITTPRQRARLRPIKARRLMYASTTPLPAFLSADAGRLRWPLLWERMGGSSLPPTAPSREVQEEESWVRDRFLGGLQPDTGGVETKEVTQHVKKLGGLLRGFEEERELEHVRERRKVERQLDEVGEEFDSESDEEDGVGGRIGNARIGPRVVEDEDQEMVTRAFEKKLVELFVDGLDVSLLRTGHTELMR
jgi:hypothetical protein